MTCAIEVIQNVTVATFDCQLSELGHVQFW
jgi:hypothetical protein